MKNSNRTDTQHARFLFFLCALCAFAVQLGSGETFAHADGPVALAEYQRIVAQTLSLLTQAQAQTVSERRQTLLTQAADLLGSVRAVRMDTGENVSINNEQLVDELRSPTADLGKLRTRIQALRDALAESPAQLNRDDQAKLRDLLNRPPFKQEIDPLTRLINEWLERLFGNAVQGIFETRYLIVALGLLLILLVLSYFIINLRRSTVSEALLQTATRDDAAHFTSSAALDSAQHFASRGDYRSAVRQLYLSTLLLLDERGRLRYDRSLTNREYLRAVANTPNIRDALRPIVETFDRIWYGFVPITANEFEQYRVQVEAIRQI